MAGIQETTSESPTLPTDLKAEQALGFIGLGLMQKMMHEGGSNWTWTQAEANGQADLLALRQRLELTSLAIQTGAPLSTAEVSKLLGARPGSKEVTRGGLVAKRVSRNVWKLSIAGKGSGSNEDGFNGDGLRRRL